MSEILFVDPNKCTGHGRCYVVAPDLLSDNEEGFVEQSGVDLEVSEALIAQARAAVNACPESAITLREQ